MNISTIFIALLVVAIFLAIIIKGVKNKKGGKSSCSCGCSCGGCPMGGNCHKPQ